MDIPGHHKPTGHNGNVSTPSADELLSHAEAIAAQGTEHFDAVMNVLSQTMQHTLTAEQSARRAAIMHSLRGSTLPAPTGQSPGLVHNQRSNYPSSAPLPDASVQEADTTLPRSRIAKENPFGGEKYDAIIANARAAAEKTEKNGNDNLEDDDEDHAPDTEIEATVLAGLLEVRYGRLPKNGNGSVTLSSNPHVVAACEQIAGASTISDTMEREQEIRTALSGLRQASISSSGAISPRVVDVLESVLIGRQLLPEAGPENDEF